MCDDFAKNHGRQLRKKAARLSLEIAMLLVPNNGVDASSLEARKFSVVSVLITIIIVLVLIILVIPQKLPLPIEQWDSRHGVNAVVSQVSFMRKHLKDVWGHAMVGAKNGNVHTQLSPAHNGEGALFKSIIH